MKILAHLFFVTTLLIATAQTTPASAITAELANKCRQLSIKAFPPARVGTKSTNAAEARKYYNDCVAKGGNVPDVEQQKPATAPAR